MEYIKVSIAAEKWIASPRRVRLLCAEGKIDGVVRKGKLYMIPENAKSRSTVVAAEQIYYRKLKENVID